MVAGEVQVGKYIQNKKVIFQDLQLIDYRDAWDYQESLLKQIVDQKIANRDLLKQDQIPTENYLLTCEHSHVYTLGKSGKSDHLLLNDENLKKIEASYFPTNRGGDITYHGPGQVIVYPIIDLENFFTDIHKYLRYLEEAVILTLAGFNIPAGRIKGLTGVWIAPESINPRKICAMGIRSSRWVTMHGLALNVNTDLEYFGNIIPCGINDKAVTSMAFESGETQSLTLVKRSLIDNIIKIFGMELTS